MLFSLFKKKQTPPTPERQIPLDENTKKFVDRILELCAAGKLEWYQDLPAHNEGRNTYRADYKNLIICLTPIRYEMALKIVTKEGAIAFCRNIHHQETKSKLETAVWEHSFAKKFLDEFLADHE